MKIECNIYRFTSNVSQVYLEIARELNTFSDINVALRTHITNAIESYVRVYLAILSCIDIDDEFKTEIPNKETAVLKKRAIAKPLQVVFSISSAFEIDVPWTSLGENQLQVR